MVWQSKLSNYSWN